MDKAYLELSSLSPGIFSGEVYGSFVDASNNNLVSGLFSQTSIKQKGLEISVLGFDNKGNAIVVLPQNTLDGKHYYLVESKNLRGG